MTHAEVHDIIAAWRLLWPSAQWRAENMKLAIEVWEKVMTDIDYREAEAVIVEHSRSGAQFPPNPGEIVERVIELREQRDGTAAPSLDVALSEVQFYVRHRGLRRPPDKWSHPAVANAVRAIGWPALCEMSDTTRAHFLRVYGEARERVVTEQRMSPAMKVLLEAAPKRPELTA